MPYTPLTKEQFTKAQAAGFSTQHIIANEQKRKALTIHQDSRIAGAKAQGIQLPETDTRAQGITQGIFSNRDLTGKESPNNLGKTVGQTLSLFGKNVGNDFMNSAKTMIANDQAQYTGQKSSFDANLQNVGEVARSVFAPINEAVKPVVQGDAAALSNNSLFKKVANSPVGGAIENAENAVGTASDAFSQKFPEAGKDIGAIGNIAMLLAGPDAEKTTVDTASGVSEKVGAKVDEVKTNKVESMKAKQAAEIDKKLGADKNTVKAVKTRKANAMTGAKTTGQVLVDNGIPLDKNTVATLNEHIAVRDAANQAVLQTEPKYASLDEAAAEAKKSLTSQGTDRIKQEAIIDQELAAYKQQYAGHLTPDGKMPLVQMDKAKGGLWNQTFKGSLTAGDKLDSQAKLSFGEAIKKSIETNSENPDVKVLNRQRGDFMAAKKSLENVNIDQLGKRSWVAKTGQKVMGAIIGGHLGVGGAIAGAEMASTIGDFIGKLPDAIRSAFINNLKETPEGMSVLQKVQDLINQRKASQATRPLFGKSDTIYAGGTPDKSGVFNDGSIERQIQMNTKQLPPSSGQGNVITLPAKTQSTLDADETKNLPPRQVFRRGNPLFRKNP